MYSMLFMISLSPAPDVSARPHLFRGGCQGSVQSAGCAGSVAVRGGCSGAVAARAGCSGSIAHSRTVTRTRTVASAAAVAPVAAPPVVAVAQPAAPVPPPTLPVPMTPAYVASPPMTAPVGMGFFVDRSRTLFGRVRGAVCSGGGCGR